MLEQLQRANAGVDLPEALIRIWQWLADPSHRDLLALRLEGCVRSVTDPHGPWVDFGAQTVSDWLALLKQFQPRAARSTTTGTAQRTAALALLRGALLDLLATGDTSRIAAALRQQLSGSWSR